MMIILIQPIVIAQTPGLFGLSGPLCWSGVYADNIRGTLRNAGGHTGK